MFFFFILLLSKYQIAFILIQKNNKPFFGFCFIEGPTPVQAQHAQQQQARPSLSSGEKVLPVPVGKQQSFKSRLQAGGFQTNQPNQAQQQQQQQQQNVPTQQPRSTVVPQDRIKQIQQRIQQQKQEQNKPQPMLPPRQQQPVRPVSRTSLETTSKFDMYDYEENYDIDLNIYDKNNKKFMLNSSKINSFNDTNSDIIDIDFEQYDQEIETPTERLENADSDSDSKSKNILFNIPDFYALKRLSNVALMQKKRQSRFCICSFEGPICFAFSFFLLLSHLRI